MGALDVRNCTLPAPIRPNEVELPAELVEPDLVLGRRFRANASKLIESAHGEFVALYQINDIHLRGYGLIDPGSRPPYVIVLGDSFVEGWGVMSDSTFVKEIERAAAQDGRHALPHALI